MQSVARELVVDTTKTPEEVQQALLNALGMDHGILSLEDERGGRVVVPVDKLAYLELGEEEPRKVGFGTV